MKVNCIICPRGCELLIEESGKDVSVKGNACKRGADYGMQEFRDPRRMVTSTVRIKEGGVLPVKTSVPVPKNRIFDVLAEIKKKTVSAPVAMGEIVIKDVCGLGVDIVASKTTE